MTKYFNFDLTYIIIIMCSETTLLFSLKIIRVFFEEILKNGVHALEQVFDTNYSFPKSILCEMILNGHYIIVYDF